MLDAPKFYVLLLVLLFVVASRLLIVNMAYTIAQELVQVNAATAAFEVSIIAITNAAGRITWGKDSDRLGLYKTFIIMFALLASAMPSLTAAGIVIAAILYRKDKTSSDKLKTGHGLYGLYFLRKFLEQLQDAWLLVHIFMTLLCYV